MDLLASFLKKQFEDNHQPDDHWKWSESCSVMPDSLQPHRLYSSWNSPGQNTGVCSLSLSRESFQPRDWTQASRKRKSYVSKCNSTAFGWWSVTTQKTVEFGVFSIFIPWTAWSKEGEPMVYTVRTALYSWDPLNWNSQDVVWGLSVGY